MQKPIVGSMVHFYSDAIVGSVGYSMGYGERADGPYAALVTNDKGEGLTLTVFLPGVPPMEYKNVPHQDEQGQSKVYWEWRTPLEKARAAKAA